MKTDIAIVESDSVIVSMMRANSALAGAVTVSQTKKIMDVARAAEIYAKRQHLSDEAIGQATSVKVEAMRKLGEILLAAPKATGARGLSGGGTRGSKKEPRVNEAPTLDELGLTKKESSVAQKIAALPEKSFEQVRAGSLTISKAIAAVDATKPKPKPALVIVPAVVPVPEEPVPEDEYTPMDAAQDQIHELQAELVVARINSTDSDESKQAAALIAELRAYIKTLEATNKALTVSRNTFQAENAQLKKQINMQRREIDKVTGRKTA